MISPMIDGSRDDRSEALGFVEDRHHQRDTHALGTAPGAQRLNIEDLCAQRSNTACERRTRVIATFVAVSSSSMLSWMPYGTAPRQRRTMRAESAPPPGPVNALFYLCAQENVWARCLYWNLLKAAALTGCLSRHHNLV